MAEKKDDGFILQAALIAGIAYFALKPLLNIFSSPEREFIQQSEAVPASQSPFSYLFQPYLDVYGGSKNGRNRFSDYPNGEKGFWEANKQMLLNMPGIYSVLGTVYGLDNYVIQNGDPDIAYLGESLLTAIAGVFGSDKNEVLRIFSLMESQVTVAAVAAYIYYNYGFQLLPYMMGGNTTLNPLDGLNNGVLSDIIQRVNSLPVTIVTD